ncbi:MAG: acetate--CoA ligase family protein, partial [Acidimicrobiia bacterium]|nr:acetate--CoA ligase family protein [Acidimicrobiia bacterium]
MSGTPIPAQQALREARAQGRSTLFETEALAVAAALGVGIPAHLVVPGPAEVERFDLGMLIGDRVVVKALAPGLVHKTEAGGVEVVAKQAAAISSAIAGVAERIPGAVAFMVAEYVEHQPGPGGQALLGMRWTDEFGPVVTFGFGGVAAEFLSGLAPDLATAVFSPALRGGIGPALDACAATGPITKG